jgi:hypothetical protein
MTPDRVERRMSTTEGTTDAADRVRVTYRPADAASADPDDDFLAESVRADTFRTYLRRAHAGPVAVGDEWTEFVNCGCGTTEDVALRVAAVEGGSVIDGSTGIEFVDG